MKIRHILPLLLLLAATAAAQHYERRIDRRFDVDPRPRIVIDSRYGSVRVTGTDKPVVTVNAVVRVKDESQDDARRIAEDVRIDITGSRNDVRVVTRFEDEGLGRDRSVEILLTLSIPTGSRLGISNKFGPVNVKGVTGEVKSVNQFGAVEVLNSGNVVVENSFGSTMLGAITGAIRITGRNGRIKAYDIPGGSITNAYGSIDVTNARGPLQVTSKMGEVTLRGLAGGTIKSEYGKIAIILARSFSGTITAETSFGDIDSDLDIDIQRHGTKATARGRHGTGNATLTVTNKFGAITLTRASHQTP